MSSKTIYRTTPYFYTIQHKSSKKMYAGAKWTEGCHPDEFMQPKGYQTSSVTINDIIEQEGLEAFETLRLDTNLDGMSAYNYETMFLQENDCAGSDDWYNGHNNNGVSWGIEEYKEKLLKNYGVENIFQLESVKCKSKKTNLKKYGVENVSQSQEIKFKKTTTYIENWGVEHHFKSQEIKDNIKESCLLSLGVEYPMQSQEVRDKSKKTIISQYSVENVSQYMFFTIIENKKTYAKNILSRLYPEFKTFY